MGLQASEGFSPPAQESQSILTGTRGLARVGAELSVTLTSPSASPS